VTAKKRWSECPESVSGHDPAGTRDGKCAWCGRQVDPWRPVNYHQGFEPSDLREAYDYYHDPDFGALDTSQIRNRYETGRES